MQVHDAGVTHIVREAAKSKGKEDFDCRNILENKNSNTQIYVSFFSLCIFCVLLLKILYVL